MKLKKSIFAKVDFLKLSKSTNRVRMQNIMLHQKTKELEGELKKARVVVEWDGTREMLGKISEKADSCAELIALGVRHSVTKVLDDIVSDMDALIEIYDTIILKETGETVLVIINTSRAKGMDTVDHNWVKFVVNPKDQETGNYHWPNYDGDAFDGISIIVHHIGKWNGKKKSKGGFLSWLGF